MKFFAAMGITDIHISDRGKEFTNSLAKELFKRCGVHHHITTPYHHQENGMERMNRTTSEIDPQNAESRKETKRLGQLHPNSSICTENI